MDLPWKTIYSQSTGEFDWAGGISAAATTTTDNNDDDESTFSPLAYWSLAGTIGFTLLVYFLEGNLDARQKKSYQIIEFPKELEKTVAKIDAQKKNDESSSSTDDDDDNNNKTSKKNDDKKDSIDKDKPLLEQLQAKFKSSQTYGLDKINFGMIAGTYETFESIVILLVGIMPFLWDQSVKLGGTYLGVNSDEEIKISLIFLLLQTIVGTITGLPFELYKTFNIEKKHGFNKQTYGLFFSDKVKGLILQCVIGGPFVALLLKIIKVRSCSDPFRSYSFKYTYYTGGSYYLFIFCFLSLIFSISSFLCVIRNKINFCPKITRMDIQY
jgi:STE24 endopeptidase